MRKTKEAPVWEVVITQAAKYRPNYYDFDGPVSGIENMMAVRLTYGGEYRTTYGTISVSDENFDEKITAMKAAAEERAGSLNAVGAI